MANFRTAQCILTGVAGTPWYMNFSFMDDGTVSPVEVADALSDWADAYKGNLLSGISIGWDGVLSNRDTVTGAVTGYEFTSGFLTTGTYVKEPLPFSTQMLMVLNTGVTAVNSTTGRTSLIKGRINLPGLTVEETDAGSFISANVVYQAGLLQDLNDAAKLVVYSPGGRKTVRVQSVTGDTVPAVLRSRRD